ncbi:MAG TPA: response regulator [Polyangiaceae bacterium]|jgi:signal transduction histidine kinase|nr:response regulator [Polyangiaceae bacterium]
MSEALEIILVEDAPYDAQLVLRELRRGGLECDVRQVYDEETFLDALKTEPDLVLSDYELPGFDGLSALALLKQRYPDVPFILISGAIGEELAVTAMREGAADYLLKDRLSRLPTAIRTALSQAALRKENRLLEERLLRAARLESLGRLSAGIAHDLNNILLPIMMAQHLLREEITTPTGLEVLQMIETSALRGAHVLRQLLMFGRGTNNQRIPLLPQSVIHEVCAMMRETFPKDLEVRTQVSDPQLAVLADPTQLQQILLNLCVNARDAMRGGGVLRIGLEQQEASPELTRRHPGSVPGPHVVLSVRDTGSGIAADHLDSIFDPFFTTKGLEHGTGLGLSSVLGIVQSYGGFVQVESRVGFGTEFRVWLRQYTGSVQDLPAQSLVQGRPGGRGQLVLIVDDERAILEVLGACISRVGYRVVQASDGASALTLLDTNPPEVSAVVTDLAMPGVDGLRLVQELRKRNATLPILVMTAALSAQSRKSFMDLGVSEFLIKPFQTETLLNSLARALAEVDSSSASAGA